MKKYFYRLFKWIFKGIPVVKVPANVSITASNKRLEGAKIMVTGGSKGIGYHLAKRFVSEGAKVIIVGRDESTLQKSAQELGCRWIKFDLAETQNLGELIKSGSSELGGLTGLVNNAGICINDDGFLNVSEKSYDEQFQLNVKSPFFLTQAFIDYVIKNNNPTTSILFITSERGLYPDDAPYGMTKAAIGNIVAGIARRFATNGVHCNAIAPGVTADTLNAPSIIDDIYLMGAAGKRYIIPDEIAELATFLMSDSSKCISGETFPCNQANHYK